MKGYALLLTATLSALQVSGQQSPPCQQALANLTVPQRTYIQVDASPFAGRVYLYAPDIKTGFFGGGFESFQLWIVEGIYGKPFVQTSASLDEPTFERIRRTRNVVATPINVAPANNARREAFKISKETFVIEIVKVNRSWGGTDSVTVKICR